MAISDEEVAQVRAATDLVALVGEHSALRQQGRRWVGLCPFHAEKTPSFSVNAEAGFYYCFGCHASGDAITFVRETEHLGFVEAVRFLADRAGIVVHDSAESGVDRQRRAELLSVMERAVAWYHERLLSAPDAGRARDYLRSRGYDGETVRRFRLGWAPDDWDVLARALQVPDRVLTDSGLGFVNRSGRQQDAFRARVLFPICDPSGRPVALGGRILPAAAGDAGVTGRAPEPKYKNSPETPIYAKRRTLYALNWAKEDVVATGEVVVCEGYTDVIGCFRAGVPRAVATCGTALAEDHFRLLRNFGRRIVLAYDADQAGQSAIARVYEWERRHDVDLRVAALPAGSDPGDLARTDPEALRAAVAGAVPFLQFRVDRMLTASDLSTAEGRAKAAEAAVAAVAEHPDPLVRDQYVMEVADRTRLPANLLRDQLEAALHNPRPPEPKGGRRRSAHDRHSTPSRPERAPAGAARLGHLDGPPPSGNGGAVHRGSTPTLVRRTRPAPANRPGLEALRLAVHWPELVADRLEAELFADELHRRAFETLAGADDLTAAVAGADDDVAELLRRLIVEEPLAPDDPHSDPADPVVAQLVREAANRALRSLDAEVRREPDRLAEVSAESATLKKWLQELNEPGRGREVCDRLVAWLCRPKREDR